MAQGERKATGSTAELVAVVADAVEWLTLAAAAREVPCARLTLMTEALAGGVITDQRAGMTFVERKSLDAFIARREAAKKAKGTKKARAHR